MQFIWTQWMAVFGTFREMQQDCTYSVPRRSLLYFTFDDFHETRRSSTPSCAALLCRISPKSHIKVDTIDRYLFTPLNKDRLHFGETHKTQNHRIIFFVDIRRIVSTLDDKCRKWGVSLRPSVSMLLTAHIFMIFSIVQ